MEFLLAHDLGTSGNKAVLYSTDGTQGGSCTVGYSTNYPAARHVEQNPAEWWNAVCTATKQLLKETGVQPGDVIAVSFSAQMLGCLPVDKSGEPIRPSIIWADLRSGAQAQALEERLGQQRMYEITGHRISSSYTATKIAWVKEHEPDTYRRMARSLQAKDYIIYRLTGEFVTDYSDACGTNLFDIRRRTWSAEIADALGIEISLMPEAVASIERVGSVTREAGESTGLLEGTPVIAGGGDGACAATGAGVTAPGSSYVVIGTSSWIATASDEPLFDEEMRTFNWIMNDGEHYSPCGTMQSAGFSYGWFKGLFEELRTRGALPPDFDLDTYLGEQIHASSPGAGGVLFLPYLMGERSPRWNPSARAAFLGLTSATSCGDMARSVLEGVALNLRTILEAFGSNASGKDVVAIGGGATNTQWLPMLASSWHRSILIPRHVDDATSLGAAMCAGVGVGAIEDLSRVTRFNPVEHTVSPDPALEPLYDTLHELFESAYGRIEPLFEGLEEVSRSAERMTARHASTVE